MTFKRERLAAAATDEMIAAVDVADMLVKRGVPFRAVARDRRRARARRRSSRAGRCRELTREELAEHSDVLDDEFYSVLSQGSWLESKVSEGGTSLERVREQLGPRPARRCDSDVLSGARLLRPAGARGGAATCWAASCVTATRAGVIVETEAYHYSRAGVPRVRRA